MFALGKKLMAMCSSKDTTHIPSYGHPSGRRDLISSITPEDNKWKLTNIGAIGSDEDKLLREKAAESEAEFEGAGEQPGIEIWRVEKFEPKRVDIKSANLSLYSGDCYIVLRTFLKEDSDVLDWQLHYWIGKDSTQDESGSAAYFTVNLDDMLHQKPVQYREPQYNESKLFHSHFKSVTYLDGGVDSGFKSSEPEVYKPRLLQMASIGGNIRVLQVPLTSSSLNDGDVFILDNGLSVYQFNAPNCNVKERIRAMEIVNEDIRAARDGEPELIILDGDQVFDCEPFWELLGEKIDELPAVEEDRDIPVPDDVDFSGSKRLYKISNESGEMDLSLEKEEDSLSEDDVNEDDIWIVTCDGHCFIHIGSTANKDEKMYVWNNCDAILQIVELEDNAPTVFFSKDSDAQLWTQCFS